MNYYFSYYSFITNLYVTAYDILYIWDDWEGIDYFLVLDLFAFIFRFKLLLTLLLEFELLLLILVLENLLIPF